MHQRLLFTLLLLIVVTIIIIVIINRNKNSSSNTRALSQKFGLSSSTGSKTFADNKEAIKMTLPLILKNTIISLKPLGVITDIIINPLDITNKSLNPSDYVMYGNFINNNTATIPVTSILYYNDVSPPQNQRFIYFITQDDNYHKMVEYDTYNKKITANYYKSASLNIKDADWINANSTTNYKVKKINNIDNYYPSVIREGLFYINLKGTNKYIYKNEVGGLELRDGPHDLYKFSNVYQSGILNNSDEQLMPFFLKFKEKDEIKKEYTFYVKSFLGDIGNEKSFKNIGIKPFYQAGYNNLTAKFQYGCEENSEERGFEARIDKDKREKILYSEWAVKEYGIGRGSDFNDNEISWYSMPVALKGTAYSSGFNDSEYINNLAPNSSHSSYDCGGGEFLEDDAVTTIKLEYENPDIPCLSIMDSTSDDSSCEFKFVYDKNGNLHLEKDSKYLHFWYGKFAVFNDNYVQRPFFELVPVLHTEIDSTADGNLAERYYKASMEFLKKDDGKTALANFCGSQDTFNDGTKKIYPTSDDLPPTDIIEKAFSSICDCNMDKAYYSKLLCPDIMIQTQYGLDPSEPTFKQYANQIRGTIKCEEPNCRFNKCYNWYEQPPPEGGSIRSLFIDAPGTDYTPSRECGGTICITNQKVLLEQGATLQNSPVIFDNITSCGGEEYKPTTEELGDLIIDNKVLKKQVRCKVKDKVVNNTAKGCNPNGFIKYLDFTTSKIVSNTVNTQTGERVIKINGVISDKDLTPEELKMQIDFIKSNIPTSS